MQDTISCDLQQFDLDGFLAAYRAFYGAWSDAPEDFAASVYMMKSWDHPPVPNDQKANVKTLLLEGWLVFVPMHEPLADDDALCIGGGRVSTEEFDIGLGDFYGYLIELAGARIMLHPALYDGSSRSRPRIDLQGHCSALDARMPAFVAEYVR